MNGSSMPMEVPGDFGKTQFVAGALTGRRAFRIIRDSVGIHLLGPVYEFPWTTDGVNHARCQSPFTNLTQRIGPHQIAGPACKCGFWAYFGETPETRTFRNATVGGFGVEGIIFGFGMCGAGEKGFRCAKAKILALVIPDQCEDLELLTDAMEKFNHVRWYGTFDAAVRDWPLSKAKKYNLIPPSAENEVA